MGERAFAERRPTVRDVPFRSEGRQFYSAGASVTGPRRRRSERVGIRLRAFRGIQSVITGLIVKMQSWAKNIFIPWILFAAFCRRMFHIIVERRMREPLRERRGRISSLQERLSSDSLLNQGSGAVAGEGEVSAGVFFPDPFLARTPRDSNFIERVSIRKRRTTANGRFRVCVGFCSRFGEPPIYTGVRMLEISPGAQDSAI